MATHIDTTKRYATLKNRETNESWPREPNSHVAFARLSTTDLLYDCIMGYLLYHKFITDTR